MSAEYTTVRANLQVVTEEARTGWTATPPITHDFVVTSGNGPLSHTFVNFENVDLTVCKEDTEGNRIVGWGVSLDEDDQVTICHMPPGRPSNGRTITISINALPAHLAHGDIIGPCENAMSTDLEVGGRDEFSGASGGGCLSCGGGRTPLP